MTHSPIIAPKVTHLSHLLSVHMPSKSEDVLVRFLPTHEQDPLVTWSYAELHERARRVAAALRAHAEPGERALIMTADPRDAITAMFGCWYAGLVAVPVYPPDKARRASSLGRLASIVRDCAASCILMPEALSGWMQEPDAPEFVHSVVLEEAIEAEGVDPDADFDGEHVALLQYTSGSTGEPKGVILTHANLIANLALFHAIAPLDHGETIVNWMPLFHDLGLSFCLCAPYLGTSLTLLSPEGFLRRPARWLEAISTYRGAFSGAPNFAYELCMKRISDEEMEGLDLSVWRFSVNAAEPVRAQTIDDFCARFSRVGFSRDFVMPSYGLAEATAFGSAGRTGPLPVLALDSDALRDGRVELSASDSRTQAVVSCGRSYLESEVCIVEPESGERLGDLEVGELWMTGPQIGLGYWGQEARSREVFGARIEGDERAFLRTGDLGFTQAGEVFITGRIKDLIILRGRNHYPQDIELTVERSDTRVRPGCVAAFAVHSASGNEELAVIAEVRAGLDPRDHAQIAERVRAAILTGHDIPLGRLALVGPRTVHKTSSGKIQRRACRKSLLAGEFDLLLDQSRHKTARDTPSSPTPHEAMTWLAHMLAEHLDMPPEEIHPTHTFSELGLDSASLVGLLPALEARFMRRLEPQIFYAHPTLAKLAGALTRGADARTTERAPAPRAMPGEPIAVIGAACRLPGGIVDLGSLWSFLLSGEDAISPVPETRWGAGEVDGYGAFLDGIDMFDAAFFGVSRQEARQMDPQQRLLLEVVWEALEHAGTMVSGERDDTGVFVGMSGSDYASLKPSTELLDGYTGTATLDAAAAGRIAHALDLGGPAMVLDTACSSSLVALHMACQSLRQGESSRAIACGVNLVLTPTGHRYLSHIGAMAHDGRCKTFDERADGYVRGEGCVAVVLKPLDAARRDGDRILGVVQGSSVNHDGRTNGLTAPSVQAQRTCYERALARAGKLATQISYIEAHGTGTQLGDPIEVQGLMQVYGEDRAPDEPVYLGAVKSQLGHGEAVAGLTGVLKVLCMFAHAQIPAQAHFTTPNPLIDWSGALRVPRTTIPWERGEVARHAAVSGFGISGTNAHVILSEPLDVTKSSGRNEDSLSETFFLPLSARHPQSLQKLATRYADLLEETDTPLRDVLHSASARRAHHHLRKGVVAQSREELVGALRHVDAASAREARQPRVVFVFPGHGSQWAQMGESLWEIPVCREAFVRCERAFGEHVDWSLEAHLLSPDSCEHWSRIDRVQPMIFAVQVALASLWRAWGIEPEAVIGHSMGEIAAMYVAGALSMEDAARIICTRSKLMLRIEGSGEMAVVGISFEEAARWMAPWSDEIAIGVHNSPEAVVFSGSPLGIQAMMDRAERQDVFARRVKIKLASHSPQTEVLREDLLEGLAGISPQRARLPIFSTVDAAYIEDTSSCTPRYWFRNLREPVRFASSLHELAHERTSVFVEISPHPVLCSAMNRLFERDTLQSTSVPSMRRDQRARSVMMTSTAHLYETGHTPRWEAFHARGEVIDLPRYPFWRERYWWREADAHLAPAPGSSSTSDVLYQSALRPEHFIWPLRIDLEHEPWLRGHKVKQALILPATYYIALAMEAATRAFGAAPAEFSDLEFSSPLFVPVRQRDDRSVQLELLEMSPGVATFQIASREREDASWVVHARGMTRAQHVSRAPTQEGGLEQSMMLDGEALYAYFEQLGLDYQGSFQRMQKAHVERACAHAAIAHEPHDTMRLHPATLDACLQALGLALVAEKPERGIFIPVRIGRLCVFGPLERELRVVARSHGDVGEVMVRDAKGAPIMWLEGLQGHPLDPHFASKTAPTMPWHDEAGEELEVLEEVWRPWTGRGDMDAALSRSRWLIAGDARGVSGSLEAHVARITAVEDPLTGELPTDLTHALVMPREGMNLTELLSQTASWLVELGALDRPLTLWLLTRGAHQRDETCPDQAALWGLSHAFELEYPHISCRRVDVDELDSPRLLDVLLSTVNETRYAIQGRDVSVARLVRARVTGPAMANAPPGKGVHIITGGYGAFGTQIARELVDTGASCVALLSRKGAHDDTRRALLEELRARGARVLDVDVDVSDEQALVRALDALEMPIASVFHTAGALRDEMLAHITRPALEQTLGAKVQGALNLHRYTASHATDSLQHFVLFSSATGTIGSPGQGAYAAANAHLDALAMARRQQGLPGKSIKWGPLRQASMARLTQVERLEQRGIGAIEPEQIAPVLRTLLASQGTGQMPLSLDMSRFQQFYPAVAAQPLFEEVWEDRAAAMTRDEHFISRLLAMPTSSRIEALERFVQQQIAGLLTMEVDQVSRTRSVQELGFDSLVTLELRNQLEAVLGVALPSSFVWRHPSVEQIAKALLDEMPELRSVPRHKPAQKTPDQEEIHMARARVEFARHSDREILDALLHELDTEL